MFVEDNISDFDGITPTSQKCKHCNLNVPDEYMIDQYCKAGQNQRLIQVLAQNGQTIFIFALILSILSIFVSTLRSYLLYIIIIAFAPVMILNQVQLRLHYRGIPEKNRIIHMLRYYQIAKDTKYYDAALATTNKYSDTIEDEYKLRILNELVESVMLSANFNPPKMMDDWAAAFSMTENELVDYLFKYTNILDGLSIIGGSGLLPDVIEFVRDEKIRFLIYDKLVDGCEKLEVASDRERQHFIEDLYIVIEDIKEELKTNLDKYQIIFDVVDSYEPEIPPKNQIDAIKSQLNEINRQQMAEMEQ